MEGRKKKIFKVVEIDQFKGVEIDSFKTNKKASQ